MRTCSAEPTRAHVLAMEVDLDGFGHVCRGEAIPTPRRAPAAVLRGRGAVTAAETRWLAAPPLLLLDLVGAGDRPFSVPGPAWLEDW